MKEKFFYVVCISFIVTSSFLYSMDPALTKLYTEFAPKKNNIEVLKKELEIYKNQSVNDLSIHDKQYLEMLENRIFYLNLKNEFNTLEQVPAEYLKENQLHIMQTSLSLILSPPTGLDPEEQEHIHNVLIPYIAILNNTNRLFQSKKPKDVLSFLPLCKKDLSKNFAPYDCLARNVRGQTLLQYAITIGLPLCTLEHLLLCGLSVNDIDNNGNNAFHIAISSANNKALKLLLRYQFTRYSIDEFNELFPCLSLLQELPQINAQNFAGQTPLHMACKKKSLDCTKILLKYNASVSVEDKECKKPIDYLLELPLDNWDHATTLICKTFTNTNNNIETFSSTHHNILQIIRNTAEHNLPTCTKQLIQQLKKKKEKIKNEFFKALNTNTLTLDMLQKDFTIINEPNKKGQTLLCTTLVNNNNLSYVRLLLENKADPNTKSKIMISGHNLELTPLEHMPMIKDPSHEKLIKLLLEYNADPNLGEQFPPLPYMAYLNNDKAINLLLDLDPLNNKIVADINIKNRAGSTALLSACEVLAGSSIVTLLLRRADANITDNTGHSPLDHLYKNANKYRILLVKYPIVLALSFGAYTFKKKIFVNGVPIKNLQTYGPKLSNYILTSRKEKPPEVTCDEYGIHLEDPDLPKE